MKYEVGQLYEADNKKLRFVVTKIYEDKMDLLFSDGSTISGAYLNTSSKDWHLIDVNENWIDSVSSEKFSGIKKISEIKAIPQKIIHDKEFKQGMFEAIPNTTEQISAKGDNFTTEIVGNTAIFYILDAVKSDNVYDLENAMIDIAKTKDIVIDFKKCSYITSVFIRTILKVSSMIASDDKIIEVRNLNDQILNLINLTGVKNLLKIKG